MMQFRKFFENIHIYMTVLCVGNLVTAKGQAGLSFRSVECKSLNDNVTKSVACSIHKKASNFYTMDVVMKVDIQEPHLLFTSYHLQSGRRTAKVVSVDVNLCDLAKNSQRKLLTYFIQNIKASAVNTPERCPYKKDTHFGVKDFNTEFGLPVFVPAYNFSATLELTDSKVGKFISAEITGIMCRDRKNCNK